MQTKYDFCVNHSKEVTYLAGAAGILGWDQNVMMPANGAQYRALQMAALEGVLHSKFTDKKFGEYLGELNDNKDKLNEDQKINLYWWTKEYNKKIKLPSDLVEEIANLTSLAQSVWVDARKKSDFKKFAPILSKIVVLKKKEVEARGYVEHRYDTLLDDFEPEITVKQLDPILANLREGLVPIIRAIKESKEKVDLTFLTNVDYDESTQEKICLEFMNEVGLTKDNSRLDKTAHPFCSGTSPYDVRIANRYNRKWLPSAIYGAVHETGHALYNLGLGEENFGVPLGEYVSYGIHESQSRLWENYIGRSASFIKYFFPKLKKYFSEQLKEIDGENFYKAVNIVEPSYLRVEADEVTYNLHILLRYELEKALFSDEIKVEDLPSLWNEKMEKYLGVKPKNDAEGVLQDIHWSFGGFGYFPSYMLGNIYAAQFYKKMSSSIPNFDNVVKNGDFEKIKSWLGNNIFKHGKRYFAMDLIKVVTGETLNAKFMIDYFKNKYGKIYNIKF